MPTLPVMLLGLALPASARVPVVDTEAPAAEPDGILDLEGDASATADTRELVAERLDELGPLGTVGAEPPVAYYLDPVAATDADPLHIDRIDPSEFDIPVVVNDDVKRWMEYFLGRGRGYYGRYLQRSTRWMPMMHRELAERGLPRDLVYLSMIESGFSPGAASYASAVGLWQFMSYTGRQYGLRVDWWVDERRDPEKATDAALRYLAYLHTLFDGSWYLAWASYNGGEGRVMNATRRAGTTDFWKIAQGAYLHTETENYVPKLLAAAIIGKHPERYGFIGIEYAEEFTFDMVEVPASTSVEVLAKCAGVSEEGFLELNPAITRWALPPDPELQRVRIPKGSLEVFTEALAKVPPAERVTFQRHTVKRGESLGSIARKYGVGVDDLARINHLRNVNRITVGMELVVPTAPKGESPEPAPAPKAATPVATTYTVKSGDTLSEVADRHAVTVAQLQSWNGLDGTVITVGQKLLVKGGAAPAPAAKTTSYTVKRGDTLGQIAARYDCTVAELKSWNGLKGETIYPGQRLSIR